MQRLFCWAVVFGTLFTACSSVSARSVSTNALRPIIHVTIFASIWQTRVAERMAPRVKQPLVAKAVALDQAPSSTPVTPVPQPILASVATDVPAPIATEPPQPVAAETPIPQEAAQNAPKAGNALRAVEAASGTDDPRTLLWTLHNKAREAEGLPDYAPSPLLQQAAQVQADFLAAKPATDLYTIGAKGHVGANGSKPMDRVIAVGYSAAAADENWAFDDTAQAAFDWWLGDQYHRPQIVSSRYTQVGFGIATHPNGGLVVVAVYGAP